jgi:fructose 1,6-bisphosphate aldolase/phosphatase
MTHTRGPNNREIHQLAWDAFQAGTRVAQQQGLYGAGQDLLKDAFSGNVRGLGPGAAELEFDERPNEPLLFFAMDKTDPGAFNMPLYRTFADPANTPGLFISTKMARGFRFHILDLAPQDGEVDRVIELDAPEDLYDIAALLSLPQRYAIESIHSRDSGEPVAAVSTSRLHNISGKYSGKDDPVALVRSQKDFPSTGEILAPYAITPLAAGFMRGSHVGALMPVRQNTITSFFDGPPLVSCAALCVQQGRLTEAVDAFDQPFWDEVREEAARRNAWIRQQGFNGQVMLPMEEREYTEFRERVEALTRRFRVRARPEAALAPAA